MSGKSVCQTCDHPESAHEYEPGFYDVRGRHDDCGYVGCPCTSYRPKYVGAKKADQ